MRTLPFPDVRQATQFSCGAAAVQGVLGYYGVDAKEADLSKYLGVTTEDGTFPKRIPAFLRHHGLEVAAGTGGTVDQLLAWVDQGIPVIVLIQAWSDEDHPNYSRSGTQEDGHYVVLIGHAEDGGILIFEDPSLLGNRGYLQREEFIARWHSESGWDRFYVAAWGKPQMFDPKRVMHIARRWLRSAR